MKKKIAGIILASVLTFSAMAGVQASAEDRLWENSMEADGVEDDISQNQTEVKDGDDSTSEDNEENTENEGIVEAWGEINNNGAGFAKIILFLR